MLPFLGSIMAAVGTTTATPSAITLAGSLSAEAATATITSTMREVTVPGGNPGVIQFQVLSLGDSGILRCKKNTDAAVFIGDGDQITFANTDDITLIVQNCLSPGDGVEVSLFDVAAGSLIQTAQLFRT